MAKKCDNLPKSEKGDVLKKQRYPYMEWRGSEDSGFCIAGNEIFKDFCEGDHACSHGKGFWKYDSTTGTCNMTNEYCKNFDLTLKKGKCKKADGDTIMESLIGKHLWRGCIMPKALKVYTLNPINILGPVGWATLAYCAINYKCPTYTKIWSDYKGFH